MVVPLHGRGPSLIAIYAVFSVLLTVRFTAQPSPPERFIAASRFSGLTLEPDVGIGPMTIYRLDPIEWIEQHPCWKATFHQETCWVVAGSEGQARHRVYTATM